MKTQSNSDHLSSEHCFSLFSELLHNQISSIKETTEYLNSIKSAIENNQLEPLQDLIKQNSIPLNTIEEQENALFSLTESSGFERNRDGLAQCIAKYDNQDKTLQSMQIELRQALKKLNTATKVNDHLIIKNKERVHKSLMLLTGNGNTSNQTYSDDGVKHAHSVKRPLAVA